jgi:mandelate racemase
MSIATPKIRGLTMRTLRVPVSEPHVTASGTVADSPLVLTDLQCDDGSVGHSSLFTYTPVAPKPAADMVRNLEPLLAGQPAALLDIQPLLARGFRLLGTQGLTGMAMAAIDMALRCPASGRSSISMFFSTVRRLRRRHDV